MTRDEVAGRVAASFGLHNPEQWVAGHNRWENKIWDALISSEMRVEELSEEQVSSEQYKCAMEVFNEEIAEWKPRAEKAEIQVELLQELLQRRDALWQQDAEKVSRQLVIAEARVKELQRMVDEIGLQTLGEMAWGELALLREKEKRAALSAKEK